MNMGSLRRRIRAFGLIWGVLQIALPLAILFGDATSAVAGSRRAAAHVEAAGSDSCAPVHTDECALCRFLSNNSATAVRAEVLPDRAPARICLVDASPLNAAAAARRLPDSRAPPIV